jgi:hypothetical protein
MLKRQDRAEGRNRGWRSNFKRLQRELLQLEEDEVALDAVFPQVGSARAQARGWARAAPCARPGRRQRSRAPQHLLAPSAGQRAGQARPPPSRHSPSPPCAHPTPPPPHPTTPGPGWRGQVGGLPAGVHPPRPHGHSGRRRLPHVAHPHRGVHAAACADPPHAERGVPEARRRVPALRRRRVRRLLLLPHGCAGPGAGGAFGGRRARLQRRLRLGAPAAPSPSQARRPLPSHPSAPPQPRSPHRTPPLHPLPPPVVAIKGNFLLGLNFLVVQLYPMRPGATMMSSFLVNVALILAMSSAVTQFCASAFASYASNTIIFEIFGNDVRAAEVAGRRAGCGLTWPRLRQKRLCAPGQRRGPRRPRPEPCPLFPLQPPPRCCTSRAYATSTSSTCSST